MILVKRTGCAWLFLIFLWGCDDDASLKDVGPEDSPTAQATPSKGSYRDDPQLTLAQSNVDPSVSEAAIRVAVYTDKILVNDELSVTLEDAHSAPAQSEVVTPIAPLLKALTPLVENEKQSLRHMGSPTGVRALMIVDEDTPFSRLAQLLYTMGQAEISVYDFLVRTGGHLGVERRGTQSDAFPVGILTHRAPAFNSGTSQERNPRTYVSPIIHLGSNGIALRLNLTGQGGMQKVNSQSETHESESAALRTRILKDVTGQPMNRSDAMFIRNVPSRKRITVSQNGRPVPKRSGDYDYATLYTYLNALKTYVDKDRGLSAADAAIIMANADVPFRRIVKTMDLIRHRLCLPECIDWTQGNAGDMVCKERSCSDAKTSQAPIKSPAALSAARVYQMKRGGQAEAPVALWPEVIFAIGESAWGEPSIQEAQELRIKETRRVQRDIEAMTMLDPTAGDIEHGFGPRPGQELTADSLFGSNTGELRETMAGVKSTLGGSPKPKTRKSPPSSKRINRPSRPVGQTSPSDASKTTPDSKTRPRSRMKSKVYDGKGMGDLNQNTVKKVFRRQRKKIKSCYDKERRQNPNISGSIKVCFDIGRTGRTSGIKMKRTQLNRRVELCIKKIVKRRFIFRPAPTDGSVNVCAKYLFKPPAGQ